MRMFATLSLPRESTVTATVQLLNHLRIPVTKSSASRVLQEHPDYPSFLSISDALNQWKVDNLCLRLSPQELVGLPVPFMAHLNTEGGLFVTVMDITDSDVTCADPKNLHKTFKMGMEEFLSIYSGFVLAVEATPSSGEPGYYAKRKLERRQEARIPWTISVFLFITACYAAYYLFSGTAFSVLAPLAALVTLAGCIVTGLLLWYEIDHNNPVLQQICSAGKTTDCEAVLKSGAAKVFKQLSWSEVGFFYFAGSFLFIIINTAAVPALWIVSWLNLVALPYTVFSVYYQWRVLQRWCVLCLAVQTLLVVQFALFFFLFRDAAGAYYPFNFDVLPQTAPFLLSFAIAFTLPVLFWSYAKPLLLKLQNTDNISTELARLKHNKLIFEGLLKKQKSISSSPEGLGIVLGGPNARNKLIKVCNPYCGPCAKAHPAIDQLLQEHSDLQVQIIFATTEDANDFVAKPVKHLLALHSKDNGHLIHQALDDWYVAETKSYDIFASKYPIDNHELQTYDAKITAMSKWCKDSDIAFTPTIFVNGHQLPRMYSITDLKYLLSE